MKKSRADLVQAWLSKAYKDYIIAQDALSKGEDARLVREILANLPPRSRPWRA